MGNRQQVGGRRTALVPYPPTLQSPANVLLLGYRKIEGYTLISDELDAARFIYLLYWLMPSQVLKLGLNTIVSSYHKSGP
jgi:hypothetical protein